MNLYRAIKTKVLVGLDQESLRFWQYHVKTKDGKLGTLEKLEPRGRWIATLRHFNGEPFEAQYLAESCELLERTL